jgi:potassium-transporting ATPase KdpC subunit
MRTYFRPAIFLLIIFTFVCGIAYPLVVTGLAQLLFPKQANGSLITVDGQIVGSELIGQQFDQPQYFWGRLSTTTDNPYNASASGGSNLGVMNPYLNIQASQRIDALKAADPTNNAPIPVDLVTASASGLDPDISIAAARYQATRVANSRNLDLDSVYTLIEKYTEPRWLGIFGEPVVNVLELNLALDALQ